VVEPVAGVVVPPVTHEEPDSVPVAQE